MYADIDFLGKGDYTISSMEGILWKLEIRMIMI